MFLPPVATLLAMVNVCVRRKSKWRKMSFIIHVTPKPVWSAATCHRFFVGDSSPTPTTSRAAKKRRRVGALQGLFAFSRQRHLVWTAQIRQQIAHFTFGQCL